jgi:thiol-disulfide isomerase/thioredoxin
MVLALVCIFSFAACKAKPAGKDVVPNNGTSKEASVDDSKSSNGTTGTDTANPSTDENKARAPSGIEMLMNVKAKDLDGKNFDASTDKGAALTVFNVWATWCPPCVEELPELAKIAKNYESKGVRVVGILLDGLDEKGNIDNSEIEAAKTFASKSKMEYPSIIPTSEMGKILDKMDAVPVTFIFKADGKFVDAIVGGMDYDGWSKVIEKALKS